MKFRNALKMMRSELGMSQTEFANAMRVNYATVNRWEAGKTYPNRSLLSVIFRFARSRAQSDRRRNIFCVFIGADIPKAKKAVLETVCSDDEAKPSFAAFAETATNSHFA